MKIVEYLKDLLQRFKDSKTGLNKMEPRNGKSKTRTKEERENIQKFKDSVHF